MAHRPELSVPPSLVRLAFAALALASLLSAAPARAQPTANWIGAWVNAEEHTTLTITGGTLSLAWPGAVAPERYQWTERRFASPKDLAAWGYAPGAYFGFDQTPVTAAAIRTALDAAWQPRMILDPGNQSVASRYAVLKSRVDRIRSGSYRRIRRFCINDRRSTTDCLAALRNEFLIVADDRLILVLIDPEIPETSNVLVFTKAAAR